MLTGVLPFRPWSVEEIVCKIQEKDKRLSELLRESGINKKLIRQLFRLPLQALLKSEKSNLISDDEIQRISDVFYVIITNFFNWGKTSFFPQYLQDKTIAFEGLPPVAFEIILTDHCYCYSPVCHGLYRHRELFQ